jgi:hypothetical protein
LKHEFVCGRELADAQLHRASANNILAHDVVTLTEPIHAALALFVPRS